MDYTPNSHKFKEEQKAIATAEEKKKVEKVVKGKVRIREKSEFRKFADLFLPEDVTNVKQFIIQDVLVPALKKVVSDTVDTILYGGAKRSNSSTSDKVSYSKYYDRFDSKGDRRPSEARVGGLSFGDLVFETRGEALDVLTRMEELVDRYGMVSVADMYEMADKSCEYTGNRYGWTSVRGADVVRAGGRDGGFIIRLPKPYPIG